MFNKKLLYCYIVILLVSFCVFFANVCLAQDTILKGTSSGACDCSNSVITTECKQYCGDYGLDDFVSVVVQVSVIVLGIVGSIALLMFIYGGVMFLISSGNSEKVTQAKQIIIGAVIGLVIVFASYTIIQFVFTALEIPNTGGGEWATIDWF